MAKEARVVNMGRGPGRGPALEKPKNPKETIGRLAKYLMAYKGQMLLVVVGIIGSSGASVASTYFLKPIINDSFCVCFHALPDGCGIFDRRGMRLPV